MPEPLVRLRNIVKTYDHGTGRIEILKGVNLDISKGDFIAVMGPSGSGKSTFLNLLGCLDEPTSGEFYLDGENIEHVSDVRLARIRGDKIGFVFQNFNLLAELTIEENIKLPFLYKRQPVEQSVDELVDAMMEKVGLAHRTKHRPAELSGGEMQRVAIARALVTRPVLLLADEPTGNLDSETGRGILNLLEAIHGSGTTIILVTHDTAVASIASKILNLKDGVFA